MVYPSENERLMRQIEEQEREAKEFGFYWANIQQLIEQIQSECLEVKDAWNRNNSSQLQEEMGDLLLAAVSLAIFCKFDPHETLLKSFKKFQKRYQCMVKLAKNDGYETFQGQSTKILENYWNRAKQDSSIL